MLSRRYHVYYIVNLASLVWLLQSHITPVESWASLHPRRTKAMELITRPSRSNIIRLNQQENKDNDKGLVIQPPLLWSMHHSEDGGGQNDGDDDDGHTVERRRWRQQRSYRWVDLSGCVYSVSAVDDDNNGGDCGDVSVPGIIDVNEIVDTTLRWCSQFVIPLKLCPWTSSSLSTLNAVRFYLVAPPPLTQSSPSSSKITGQDADVSLLDDIEELMESAIYDASYQIQNDIKTGVAQQNTVIAFVVFAPTNNGLRSWSFVDFYDWFISFEDTFLDGDDDDDDTTGNEEEERIGDFATIAPFHNDWQFGAPEEDSCNQELEEAVYYEKRSPYPTVTIVCTSEIEKAGTKVTEQIGKQNYKMLSTMGLSSVRQFYNTNVLQLRKKNRDGAD